MATATGLSKKWMNDVLGDFFALFFPNVCLGCDGNLLKGEDILCTHCLSELPKEEYDNAYDNPLVNRFIGRVPISFGISLLKFQKSGIVQNLLHQLKYANHPEVGEKLGMLLGQQLKKLGLNDKIDMLIPVPLHKNRLRARGYNQSTMIAKGIGSVLELPLSETIMQRKNPTKTQTKKSRLERWENVSQAFSVLQPQPIEGKSILLVDDVITTGATIEACSRKLLEAGAKNIMLACLAEVA